MDRGVIDEYEKGSERLALAIRGLTVEDLLAVPVPGKWSTQTVAIHLADAELAFADRIKRILATDDPPLQAWDENAFAKNLAYDQQSAEDAANTVALVRRQIARILRAAPDSAFDRAGNHSERGRQTLADVLKMATRHLDHHITFIHEKREAMGKEMW